MKRSITRWITTLSTAAALGTDDLRAVTPDARAKTHFLIVDCVGVSDHPLSDERIVAPQQRAKRQPLHVEGVAQSAVVRAPAEADHGAAERKRGHDGQQDQRNPSGSQEAPDRDHGRNREQQRKEPEAERLPDGGIKHADDDVPGGSVMNESSEQRVPREKSGIAPSPCERQVGEVVDGWEGPVGPYGPDGDDGRQEHERSR